MAEIRSSRADDITGGRPKPPTNELLYDRIVHAEFVFLVVAFVVNVAALRVVPNQFGGDVSLWTAAGSLVVLALIAPLKPLRWKAEGKILACLADCSLLTISLWCGVTRLNQPLFMVVVAKAALLLPLPGTIVLIAIAWLCQFGCEYARRVVENTIGSSIISASLLTVSPLLLMISSALAVIALDRERKSRFEAERLAQEVESLAKQLERTRISREIHDVIGHSLTSIRIQLEVASRYASLDDSEAREAVDRAKELASNALEEVRAVLRSVRIGQIDLNQALTALIEETNSTKALKVEAQIEAVELPSGVALDVFRVVQECLTNIMRHAKADHADVIIRIDREANRLYVQVADNGIGFREQDRKGSGLAGMRDRVNQLGGELEITDGENGGAFVKAIIPLQG